LNKIMVLIMVSVLFASSAVALAGNSEALNGANKAVGATDVAVELQAEAFRSGYAIFNVSNNKDSALPINGWLLTVALFGFVLLSNRTNV